MLLLLYSLGHPSYMGQGIVWIAQKSRPRRRKSMLYVTHKNSSLIAKLKLPGKYCSLEYIPMIMVYCHSNVTLIIMYCNCNLNRKYWTTFGSKLTGPLDAPDYRVPDYRVPDYRVPDYRETELPRDYSTFLYLGLILMIVPKEEGFRTSRNDGLVQYLKKYYCQLSFISYKSRAYLNYQHALNVFMCVSSLHRSKYSAAFLWN
jgi:hypothetical protein